MGLLIIVIGFALMWVLLILPQQRRMRAHQALVAALEVGDEVMTTSGIYGTIVEVEQGTDVLWVEVADGVELKMARGAVAKKLDGVGRGAGAVAADDEEDLDELDAVEGEELDELDTGLADDVELGSGEATSRARPPEGSDSEPTDR